MPRIKGSARARGRGVFGRGQIMGETAIQRVAIYTRVSTDEQDDAMQVSALRDYAKKRGWKVAMTRSDAASGASTRPKRQEVIAAACKGEVDAVLVWKLDRWGRSTVDLLATLSELTAHGAGFVSFTEAIDLSTPAGRAMTAMIAVFAEFERSLTVERVREGIAERRRQGLPTGRPASTREHASRVRMLLCKGETVSQVARKCGISRASVRRLKDPDIKPRPYDLRD